MGSGVSSSPPLLPVKERTEAVDKWAHKLSLSEHTLALLWQIFSNASYNNILTKGDFFEQVLCVPKSFFGEALFQLIEKLDDDFLTFDDYVRLTCAVCTIERSDLLQFIFNLIDFKSTGAISKDELKFFITKIWGASQITSLNTGFEFIDRAGAQSHGLIEVASLHTINARFPQLLYPAFQMQITFMRTSLGQKWWEDRIIEVKERIAASKNTWGSKMDQVVGLYHSLAVATGVAQPQEPPSPDKPKVGGKDKLTGNAANKSKDATEEKPAEKSDASVLYGFVFGTKGTAESRRQQLHAYEKQHGLDKHF